MKTIFVSSTFRDMQHERDALQRLTLPNLNRVAKTYGDTVSLCDLRWGINTEDMDEETGNSKVLNVCLDVIDRCEPIMVIILGERYGWIPGEDKIKSTSERRHMQLEDYEISVTALEIEYGAFFRRANTLVYVRDTVGEAGELYGAEDAEHAEKLAALKQRLHTLTGGRLKHYSLDFSGGAVKGVKAFAETVQKDVLALLSLQWEQHAKLSEFGRERLIHDGIFFEHARLCKAGDAFKGELLSSVRAGEQVIEVCGSAGSGKSVLMGALSADLQAAGYDVLPIAVGATAATAEAAGILKHINAYYKEVCGLSSFYEEDGEKTYYEELGDLQETTLQDVFGLFLHKENNQSQVDAYADYAEQYEETGRHLVIVIDGAEKVHRDPGEGLWYLVPENIGHLRGLTVVLSVDEPIAFGQAFCVKKDMPAYKDGENRQIAEALLYNVNRELSPRVMDAVLEKCRGKGPLYIKLLLQKLFMMDINDFAVMHDMQAITAHQAEKIAQASEGVTELGYEVLSEAAARVHPDLILDILAYISLSNEGLTERELAALCGERYSRLDFYHFIAYMGDCFLLRHNGRYDFANACIKDGVRARIQDTGVYAAPLVALLCEQMGADFSAGQRADMARLQELIHICTTHAADGVLLDTLLYIDGLATRAGRQQVAGYETLKEATNLFLEQADARMADFVYRMADKLKEPGQTEEACRRIRSALQVLRDGDTFFHPGRAELYVHLFANRAGDFYAMQESAEIYRTTFINHGGEPYFCLAMEQYKAMLDMAKSQTKWLQWLETVDEMLGLAESAFTLLTPFTAGAAATVTETLAPHREQLKKFAEDDFYARKIGEAYIRTLLLRAYAAPGAGYRAAGDVAAAVPHDRAFFAAYRRMGRRIQGAYSELTGNTRADVHRTLARVYAAAGEAAGDRRLLADALWQYKQYKKHGRREETFDICRYHTDVANVYRAMGQEKKSRAELLCVLRIKTPSADVYGKQFEAAETLYKETGLPAYGRTALACIGRALDVALRETHTAEEMIDNLEYYLLSGGFDDAVYLGGILDGQLSRAQALCEALGPDGGEEADACLRKIAAYQKKSEG